MDKIYVETEDGATRKYEGQGIDFGVLPNGILQIVNAEIDGQGAVALYGPGKWESVTKVTDQITKMEPVA